MIPLSQIRLGCGKDITIKASIINKDNIKEEDIGRLKCNPNFLCPTCQALETQTKAFLDMINKRIRELDKNVRVEEPETDYIIEDLEELKKEVEECQ